MILVFGSINIDLVARVPSIPRPGETVLAPGYETLFGGKGANQAVAAARALAGTGIPVLMAGRVGADGFGDMALANLRQNGVDTSRTVQGAEPTGCAFITVEESGENAITVASGANGAHRAENYGLGPADLLVLQMEVPLPEALAVADTAREGGARVVWNLAPAPARLREADMRAVLGATDILVVNEHEAVAAGRALRLAPDDADAAAASLAREGGRAVILTAGARGAVAFLQDGTRLDVAAPAVRAVDTTGAGDTFVGVLAASLAVGADMRPAVERACLAASHACTQPGAQAGMPDRATLDRLSAGR